jgi:hypothetical protein
MRCLPVLLATLLAALVLAACGDEEQGPGSISARDAGQASSDPAGAVLEGEQESTYLELGGLKYQTQISRQLNPQDVEDRDYLVAIPPAQRGLGVNQVWFAVFIRVENDDEEPARSTADFAIVDTQETRYRPVFLGEENVFRYVPAVVPPGQLIPREGSAAYNGPTQGALLLFKIDQRSYENRPLELVIGHPTTDETAVAPLDV